MCFLSSFFKRRSNKAKPSDSIKAPDRQAPTQGAADKLSAMRHQAGTGDPKLKGRHRSGNF